MHKGSDDRAIAAGVRSGSLLGNMDSLPVPTDTDTTLERFALGLEHPNFRYRLGVLEALVAWLSPSHSQENPCEACSKPQARVLVRQLLSALSPMCVVNLAGE